MDVVDRLCQHSYSPIVTQLVGVGRCLASHIIREDNAMRTTLFISIAVIVLLASGASAGIDSVYVDSNRLVVEGTFHEFYYGDTLVGCTERGGDDAWISIDRCDRPTTGCDSTAGYNACHFKLIDGAGNCLLMNLRLDKLPGTDTSDTFPLKMSFPIGDTITEQNIEFLTGSYYNSVHMYSPSGYRYLGNGDSYIIELTDQCDECANRDRLIEIVLTTDSIQIPCCVGARGDVNCDGVVGDTLDLNRMIDYLFISYDPLCCYEAGDVSPIGSPNNNVDIGDLNTLIDYYNGTITSLPACPEPSW